MQAPTIDWSSQQFFTLDEQIRRLKAQLEEMTWKMDTWERGLPYTNKLRQEIKQGLELIKQNERLYFGVELQAVKSVVPPLPTTPPLAHKEDMPNTSKES